MYWLCFTVFRLLTDFVCLYTYEFWLSLCKIVGSSVILLLPLFESTWWSLFQICIVRTQVLRKGKQFLAHIWHPSCYSCNKPGDKSWIKNGPDCDYDKRNISVVICKHRYYVTVNQVMVATVQLLKWWFHLTTRNYWCIIFPC